MKLTLLVFFFSLSCASKNHDPDAIKSEGTESLNTQNTEVLVCKGSSSYAYHDHYCRGLNKCRAQIVKISVDEARKLGRTPCGYCYNSAPLKVNVRKASYKASGQCNAITKRGTRCSRTVRSGGYCWQHGG